MATVVCVLLRRDSVADLPQGMQGNLMATVVCVSRRRDSGADLPQGMQGSLMATVVCVLRRRDACMRFMGTVRFMRGVWVRHSIPRGFAVPQWGLAQSAD